MKIRSLLLVALVATLLMVSGPIFAHHGTAAYESNKLTSLKGTVTDFRYINPHSEIFFDVKDDTGKVTKWIGEAGSVTSMSRRGWNRNLLKPGDPITAVGNRAKNKSNSMRLLKIVLSDGKEYFVDRGEDYVD
jgi:hypothetical protein